MTTALYRRYRPETFAEVIGQEHVTAPLMQALRSGRVNHAYLFSGPRGCGKTTSARILARTLNCARNTPEHPIDTPCGECDSCVELARGGSGSLDVVEIDAASHNGVDDARDLRERATFAPARDRYKIFILDEAHMVTPQGFNALLKIVEEPPPHVKFVFATTEPDKVIGTIRSRTHHYPFRLVPPDVLGPYLEQLTAAEGVELGGGVVPLVTRAGGGSVRDSLSVLDQLIAGATGGVVEYDTAVGLLGFTHATLLDDVVDALAARDGASIFRVVDQVVATGHEPRRFVEDVLERLRDLIVIAVSGDAAEAVLRGLPADQLERMRTQAGRLGVAELSRAADLVNGALTEMTGATSPRLHLELLCARLLLPGADDGALGLAARIDRLERGAAAGGGLPTASPGGSSGSAGDPHDPESSAPTAGGLNGAAAARAALQASRRPDAAPESGAAEPAPAPAPAPAAPATGATAAPAVPAANDAPEAVTDDAAAAADDDAAPVDDVLVDDAPEPREPSVAPADVEEPPADGDAAESAGAEPAAHRSDARATASAPTAPADAAAEPAAEAAPAAPTAPAASDQGTTAEMLRRRWDEVVANIGSPVTRALVGPNAQVVSLDGGVLRLGFAAAGMARTFSQPRHVDAVSDSVYQTLGVQVRVEATVDEGRDGGGATPAGGQGGPPSAAPAAAPAASSVPTAPQAPARSGSGASGGPDDGGWPDVAPRGSSAGSGATSVGTVSTAGAGPRASASAAQGGGGVAVAERPAPPARVDVDEADAAWLAGTPTAEPVEWAREPAPGSMPDELPESIPEPRPDTDAMPVAPAPKESSGPPPWAQEPADSAPPAPAAASGPVVRETPRQAAERRVREAQQSGGRPSGRARGSASDAAPMDDEPSADDPDITSSGLMGVPLVVQVLGGKVIDEIAEP